MNTPLTEVCDDILKLKYAWEHESAESLAWGIRRALGYANVPDHKHEALVNALEDFLS